VEGGGRGGGGVASRAASELERPRQLFVFMGIVFMGRAPCAQRIKPRAKLCAVRQGLPGSAGRPERPAAKHGGCDQCREGGWSDHVL
jgi:hypothetical protein